MAAVDISFLGVAVFWGYLLHKILGEKDFQGAARWLPTIAAAITIYGLEYGSISASSNVSLMTIPIGFFISGMIAYVTSVMAQMKGRGPVLWFVLATFLSIIPMIILVVAPVKVRRQAKKSGESSSSNNEASTIM